jgi:hypothetical protein
MTVDTRENHIVREITEEQQGNTLSLSVSQPDLSVMHAHGGTMNNSWEDCAMIAIDHDSES